MDVLANLNLCGNSPAFLKAVELIRRFAACDVNVLLEGETGTGKDVAACSIHYLSSRREGPFIPVNCGALPDNLLESELFGHERGAFTDAKEARRGLISQAHGGTLLLDEVEAMTPRAQVVLLRFLQDHSYRTVGGRVGLSADVRVIASSNVDLVSMVRRNAFRQDLLFRLSILSVTLPALRDRPGDVPVLAEHFLERFSAQYKMAKKRLHADTLRWMERYHWPGNVRELESLMHRGIVLADGDVVHIPPPEAGADQGEGAAPPGVAVNGEFKRAKALAVAEFERSYLVRVLTEARGNMSMAARLSRKDRSAFTRLVKKHHLDPAEFRDWPGRSPH